MAQRGTLKSGHQHGGKVEAPQNLSLSSQLQGSLATSERAGLPPPRGSSDGTCVRPPQGPHCRARGLGLRSDTRNLGLRSAGPVATGPIARAQRGSEACARGRRVLAAVASAHEGVFLGWRFSFKVCVSFQVQTF